MAPGSGPPARHRRKQAKPRCTAEVPALRVEADEMKKAGKKRSPAPEAIAGGPPGRDQHAAGAKPAAMTVHPEEFLTANGSQMQVWCNGTTALFDLRSFQVVCMCNMCTSRPENSPIPATEFERHAGMAMSKKWRRSLKVGNHDNELTLGKYLAQVNEAQKQKEEDATAKARALPHFRPPSLPGTSPSHDYSPSHSAGARYSLAVEEPTNSGTSCASQRTSGIGVTSSRHVTGTQDVTRGVIRGRGVTHVTAVARGTGAGPSRFKQQVERENGCSSKFFNGIVLEAAAAAVTAVDSWPEAGAADEDVEMSAADEDGGVAAQGGGDDGCDDEVTGDNLGMCAMDCDAAEIANVLLYLKSSSNKSAGRCSDEEDSYSEHWEEGHPDDMQYEEGRASDADRHNHDSAGYGINDDDTDNGGRGRRQRWRSQWLQGTIDPTDAAAFKNLNATPTKSKVPSQRPTGAAASGCPGRDSRRPFSGATATNNLGPSQPDSSCSLRRSARRRSSADGGSIGDVPDDGKLGDAKKEAHYSLRSRTRHHTTATQLLPGDDGRSHSLRSRQGANITGANNGNANNISSATPAGRGSRGFLGAANGSAAAAAGEAASGGNAQGSTSPDAVQYRVPHDSTAGAEHMKAAKDGFRCSTDGAASGDSHLAAVFGASSPSFSSYAVHGNDDTTAGPTAAKGSPLGASGDNRHNSPGLGSTPNSPDSPGADIGSLAAAIAAPAHPILCRSGTGCHSPAAGDVANGLQAATPRVPMMTASGVASDPNNTCLQGAASMLLLLRPTGRNDNPGTYGSPNHGSPTTGEQACSGAGTFGADSGSKRGAIDGIGAGGGKRDGTGGIAAGGSEEGLGAGSSQLRSGNKRSAVVTRLSGGKRRARDDDDDDGGSDPDAGVAAGSGGEFGTEREGGTEAGAAGNSGVGRGSNERRMRLRSGNTMGIAAVAGPAAKRRRS